MSSISLQWRGIRTSREDHKEFEQIYESMVVWHIIIIIIIKIETTLQPEAELRGLHIITCTTYKYIINTIL
jgi:hypothetical protein